jgi:predicted HTH domain antitoxin
MRVGLQYQKNERKSLSQRIKIQLITENLISLNNEISLIMRFPLVVSTSQN